VTYRYGEDGVIQVRAKDVASGKEVTTQVKPNAGELSDEQVALHGRKVSHLLEEHDQPLTADSDDSIFAEFNQGYAGDD
jgi:molecular chaperone DnaK (HSP70)